MSHARRPDATSADLGERVQRAFDELEEFPALSESRRRLLHATRLGPGFLGEVAAAVEGDVAFAIAVLRLVNRSGRGGKTASVKRAVATLSSKQIQQLAEATSVATWSAPAPGWEAVPGRFRAHALASAQAAAHLARELGHAEPDELVTAALLHDIGKLVLVQAYPDYEQLTDEWAETPEQRIKAERRALGVDHAAVGGALARHWALPERLARAIEEHHGLAKEQGPSPLRLVDTLAHHIQGHRVAIKTITDLSRSLGIGSDALGSLMYDLAFPLWGGAARPAPCPLSPREQDVLRGLAEGKVYKQIARDLGLSVHTVRNHVHRMFGKLGVADRAEAVLLATEHHWI